MSLSSIKRIRRPNKISPPLNRMIPHKLNTHYQIARNKVDQVIIKWLTLMLRIKLRRLLLRKPQHFDIGNCELLLLNSRYNFPNILIGIRFNHSECSLSLTLKTSTGEDISIVSYF